MQLIDRARSCEHLTMKVQQRAPLLTSLLEESPGCTADQQEALLLVQSSKSRDDTTASVIPVRLRAGTVALESSFSGGIKRELLRSLCQVDSTMLTSCMEPVVSY